MTMTITSRGSHPKMNFQFRVKFHYVMSQGAFGWKEQVVWPINHSPVGKLHLKRRPSHGASPAEGRVQQTGSAFATFRAEFCGWLGR